jgi:hypothetical protein
LSFLKEREAMLNDAATQMICVARLGLFSFFPCQLLDIALGHDFGATRSLSLSAFAALRKKRVT